MLLFLTHADFASLTELLVGMGLDLHDVRACVFPSRPEPARADFVSGARRVAEYAYAPDDDLRHLLVLAPDPLRSELRHTVVDLVSDDLDALAAPLTRASPTLDVRRAAASLTTTLSLDPEPDRRAHAADLLAHALDPGAPLPTRRAASELLAPLGPSLHRRAPALLGALHLAGDDPDLEVRLHARRVLDAAMR